MKLGRGFCGEACTLTPTLSRKRERERCACGRWRTRLTLTLSRKRKSCSLSPGNGGEGWGEGDAAEPGCRDSSPIRLRNGPGTPVPGVPGIHDRIRRTALTTSVTSSSVNPAESGKLTVVLPMRVALGKSSGAQP